MTVPESNNNDNTNLQFCRYGSRIAIWSSMFCVTVTTSGCRCQNGSHSYLSCNVLTLHFLFLVIIITIAIIIMSHHGYLAPCFITKKSSYIVIFVCLYGQKIQASKSHGNKQLPFRAKSSGDMGVTLLLSPKKIVTHQFRQTLLSGLKNQRSLAILIAHNLWLYYGSCTYYVITFGGPEKPPPPPM